MQCYPMRLQSISTGCCSPQPRLRHICCAASRHGADSSRDSSTSAQPATSHVQQRKQHHSRRAALAAVLLPVLGTAALPSNASVSSDLLDGTQNWLHIGQKSFGLWMQQSIDGIMNSDETGITDLEGTTRKRRFGSISVPGLSSFSFIHGALVGGAVILLLAADKLTPQQQQAGPQQHPVLNPEVEAALKQLLASPEVKAQFHDPAVHAALQEVRVDPRAIAKYRDDPVVMQAFSKLLEIENILERL